ncbi:MAG TPA: hypothetical protein VIL47_06130 [Candidatus Bipolaricaulota bacterium]
MMIRLKLALALGLLSLMTSGCDWWLPPEAQEPPVPEPQKHQALIGQRAILADSADPSAHLADIEVWMDESPRRPRIVLRAVQDLVYFDLNLSLPVCYVFPRPNQEMPGWRGGPLPAGEQVEIPSSWEKISDTCDSPYATVLWNLASYHQGARSKMSMLWEWPD